MAPYASDNTARIRVRYRAAGRDHLFIVRPPDATVGAIAAALSNADALLAALRPNMFSDFAPMSVDVAAVGESLFLPFYFAWPAFNAATASSTVAANRDSVKFVSWQGISTAGARWSLTLFGPMLQESSLGSSPYQDYRLQPSEGTPFTDVIPGELADLAQSIVAVDNMGVVVREYANVGYSAYYQRKSRKGS